MIYLGKEKILKTNLKGIIHLTYVHHHLWLSVVMNFTERFFRDILGRSYWILVGGWALPLWKIWVRQLGWWHSQLNGKMKLMFQSPPTRYCISCGLTVQKSHLSLGICLLRIHGMIPQVSLVGGIPTLKKIWFSWDYYSKYDGKQNMFQTTN